MYEITYVNPNWITRTTPEVLQTRSKAQVRAIVQRSRQYPGSCAIRSITKTTKARGAEHLSPSDF